MFLANLKSKVFLIPTAIFAAITVLSIILMVYIFPSLIQNGIFESVRLSKGTEQYDRFLKMPFPLNFEVYLFNIENPSEILNGKKPVVREVGPYIYKKYTERTIVATNDTEDTVTYFETLRYEFDDEASGNLSDTDFITVLNFPMNGVLQMADKMGHVGLLSTCIKDIFPQADVFIKVRVKDVLFDGLKFCLRHFSLCEIQRTVVCKMAETKKNVDKFDNFLEFSLFGFKNRSDGNLYTMKRGISNIHTLGQMVRINNSTYTHFWKDSGENSSCDNIQNVYMAATPPQITKNSILKFYTADICRSFEVKYLKEDVYKGIKGYKFKPNNMSFRSTASNIEDDCFCVKETQDVNGKDTCFLDGVIDLQPCTGAPVLLSCPHFLRADKSYIQNIDGLSPNEDKHESFVVLEPDTGTPLRIRDKIQISMVLRPIDTIEDMENLPRVVLPLVWVEENLALSDEFIGKLKEQYFDKLELVTIVQWTLFGASLFFTIAFATYFLHKQGIFKV